LVGRLEDEKLVENCLAAKNPLLGVGVFMFIYLPENWVFRTLNEPPECSSLGSWNKTGDFRWISNGFIRTLLINMRDKRGYLFRVDVKMFYNAEKATKYILEKMEKIKKRQVKILDEGNMYIGEHSIKFLVWSKKFKPFLSRKEKEELYAEFPIYCNDTKRLLWVKLKCDKPRNFLLDKKDLLKIISTIICHESEANRNVTHENLS